MGVGRTGAGLPRAAPSRASAWENLEGLRGYLQGNSCRSTDGTVDGSVVNGGVNGGGVNCGGEAVVRFLCKLVLFGIRRSGHVTIMGQGSEINMHNYGPVQLFLRPDWTAVQESRTVRSGLFNQSPFSKTGLNRPVQNFWDRTAVWRSWTVRSSLFIRSPKKATVRTGPDRGQSIRERLQ